MGSRAPCYIRSQGRCSSFQKLDCPAQQSGFQECSNHHSIEVTTTCQLENEMLTLMGHTHLGLIYPLRERFSAGRNRQAWLIVAGFNVRV
jgi:hypothetical protein